MVAPLIAPEHETFPNRIRWTVDACHELADAGYLKGRYEVIDGEILSKMGMNPPHRMVLKAILHWLLSLFDDRYIQTQCPILIPGEEGTFTEPEPDIAVTRQATTAYFEQHPGPEEIVIAIEIADSSLDFDTNTKGLLYARVGIQEFWVADVTGRCIHIFRDPSVDGYRYRSRVGIDGLVALEWRPADSVAVVDFFSALATEDANDDR